ncbi:MAG: hypothetical protein IJQ93_01280 [Bacteroidales bacterium]|nr:hypothetical protein [Bacteroidales bacterium]
MRKLFISLLFVLTSCPVFGQDTNQLNTMIIDCLQTYSVHALDLSPGEGNVVVCKDGLPSDFPYSRFTSIAFFSTDCFWSYSNPLKKQLKKNIPALFVSFELDNNLLKITISKKYVRLLNRKTLSIALSDWGQFVYIYSCEENKWKLMDIKYGGV